MIATGRMRAMRIFFSRLQLCRSLRSCSHTCRCRLVCSSGVAAFTASIRKTAKLSVKSPHCLPGVLRAARFQAKLLQDGEPTRLDHVLTLAQEYELPVHEVLADVVESISTRCSNVACLSSVLAAAACLSSRWHAIQHIGTPVRERAAVCTCVLSEGGIVLKPEAR